MSRADYSSGEELPPDTTTDSKLSKKRKKKSKRKKSVSPLNNPPDTIHDQSGVKDSIIDEEEDENHQSRPNLPEFLQLNEESVNVDIDTSNNQSDMRLHNSSIKLGTEQSETVMTQLRNSSTN